MRRTSQKRWLGIDFSGDHLKWRARCATSNVWIADVRGGDRGLYLHGVHRVQELPGDGDPFDRLVGFLAGESYAAAGIDAPFSVPGPYVDRAGGHAALLALVGGRSTPGRPFLRGSEMVRLIAGVEPLRPPKPLRAADLFWSRQGVNIRSPLWTGARPGAPMTAACLTLLHRAQRPMWPWSRARTRRGLLVEAFPAGQLARWELPHTRYDGPSPAAVAMRREILDGVLRRRRSLRIGKWRTTLLGCADALDAFVCAFAALAASTSRASLPEDVASVKTEGWVAVHP